MIVRFPLHVSRFTGHAKPPVKGHEIKKDISILFCIISFSGDMPFKPGLGQGHNEKKDAPTLEVHVALRLHDFVLTIEK